MANDSASVREEEVEQIIYQIWAKLLQLDKRDLNRKSNFFLLGGDSMSLMFLVSDVNEQIFSNKKVVELADVVHVSGLGEQLDLFKSLLPIKCNAGGMG